ncbi:hypothetical protein MSAN_00341400 [Mycena sanguinolenta]|uniref:Uncharacterized protein n=1 Tax=Mycena sanguinolenta TaxID=230812 RepID=A0A8H6Z8M8_9AGAR|nr:hypothetical protein MSAN_00341400 [Mycena sanguinolenta]
MSLHETTSRAEALCAHCATTPGINAFQPIAASAVEVCRAAENLVQVNHTHTTRMKRLAAYIVHKTERAVNGMMMAPLPFAAEAIQNLERIEVKLDEIRRAIEHLPRASKRGKLPKYFSSARETSRLKKELKTLVNELVLKGTHKLSTTELMGISPMEVTNFTIRTATAICEAPVLNFLKPLVGIAEIIAEIAQTVKSNRAAALELASHSSMVTKAVIEHTTALGLDVSSCNGEALVVLTSALENIHLYLTDLQKPRRRRDRLTSWIMANKEKDRIVELNQGLDKALTLFATTKVLNTHAEVREIAALVRGNDFVEEIVTQVRMHTNQLTVATQADLAAALVTVCALASVHGEEKKPNTTALVPFSTAVAQLTFFF